jgi:hypothetical protein
MLDAGFYGRRRQSSAHRISTASRSAFSQHFTGHEKTHQMLPLPAATLWTTPKVDMLPYGLWLRMLFLSYNR